jgi:hypothetical protein
MRSWLPIFSHHFVVQLFSGFVPVVSASLRPPATICKPFGLPLYPFRFVPLTLSPLLLDRRFGAAAREAGLALRETHKAHRFYNRVVVADVFMAQ